MSVDNQTSTDAIHQQLINGVVKKINLYRYGIIVIHDVIILDSLSSTIFLSFLISILSDLLSKVLLFI